MQSVIQSLESLVVALAVAAFAHFGVALKAPSCTRPAPAVRSVAYVRPASPRTIGRAPAALAKDLRRA